MIVSNLMKKIILIVSVLAILTSLIVVFYSTYVITDVEKIPIEVNISSDIMGFNADPFIPLKFGKVPPGSASKRYVSYHNNEDFKVFVDIKSSGETSRWLTAGIVGNLNNVSAFYFEPDEHKEIELVLTPTDDGIPDTTYYGTVKIITRRTFK
jgi:hypothetical protein